MPFKNTQVKREYYKKYWVKNREKLNLKHKEWCKNLKLEIFTHYGLVCTCCGESIMDFLTIDHMNGDGAEHRKLLFGKNKVGGPWFYYWLKKNNFPLGFQTLCFNCNIAKSQNGFCPHQKTDTLPA